MLLRMRSESVTFATKFLILMVRSPAKPGDIVKVKVLEIEVARKRIALTLRLDDEVGTKGKGPAAADRQREFSKASMTSSAPRKGQEQGGGALAEALRRASEKNGRPKP